MPGRLFLSLANAVLSPQSPKHLPTPPEATSARPVARCQGGPGSPHRHVDCQGSAGQVPVHRGRDHGRCRPGPSGGSKGGGLFLILPGAAFWPHPPLCSWHCHIQNTGSQLCPVPGAGARKHLGISWSRQLSGKHRQGFRCPLPDKDGEHSTPTPCPAGQQCDLEEAMIGGPCSLRQRRPCWSSSPCGRRGWVTTALGWVQSISDLQDWPHPPEKDLASSGVTVPPTSYQQ